MLKQKIVPAYKNITYLDKVSMTSEKDKNLSSFFSQ